MTWGCCRFDARTTADAAASTRDRWLAVSDCATSDGRCNSSVFSNEGKLENIENWGGFFNIPEEIKFLFLWNPLTHSHSRSPTHFKSKTIVTIPILHSSNLQIKLPLSPSIIIN